MQHPVDVSQGPSALLKCGQKYLMIKAVDQGDLKSQAMAVRDAAREALSDSDYDLVVNGPRTFLHGAFEMSRSKDGFLVVKRCSGLFDQIGNCAGVCLVAGCEAPPVHKIACSVHVDETGMDSSTSQWQSSGNTGTDQTGHSSPLYLGFESDVDAVDGPDLDGDTRQELVTSSKEALPDMTRKTVSSRMSRKTPQPLKKRKLSSSETSEEQAAPAKRQKPIKLKFHKAPFAEMSRLCLKSRELARKRKIASPQVNGPKRAKSSLARKSFVAPPKDQTSTSDESQEVTGKPPIVVLPNSHETTGQNSNSGTLTSEVTVSSICASESSEINVL